MQFKFIIVIRFVEFDKKVILYVNRRIALYYNRAIFFFKLMEFALNLNYM